MPAGFWNFGYSFFDNLILDIQNMIF